MNRLSERTLNQLPDTVRRPSYDRAALATGIVHLGIGAFARAHLAVYTEDVVAGGDRRWGIGGLSLRSAATREALAPQDGLYTVLERGSADRLRVVGALRDVLVADGSAEALLRQLCEPSVRIASLTVTEKGYGHRPASGELDESNEAIRADLAAPRAPRTPVGLLVEAIRRRREAGLPAFTALSCDNLPHNGHVLKAVLARYAQIVDADLGAFVDGEIACPSTMVDRIVPATTDADRAAVESALGVRDAWPVVAEPFSQWVIEDSFGNGRPEWERAGAEIVADVAPFEAMKLRLLNGSHSALAYLGSLAGLQTVDEAIARPEFAAFVRALMEDAADTLTLPAGTDIMAYRERLLERFANPALRHRLRQIAMDGSQKLPQRILSVVRERLAAGRPVERQALVVAAWIRFVEGRSEAGEALPLDDPMAPALRAAAERSSGSGDVADALLAIETIFGSDLRQTPTFTTAVKRFRQQLLHRGSSEAIVSALHPREGLAD